MTRETRASLIANITADIPDNTSGQIDASDVRENMIDAADSALFPEDLGLDDIIYVTDIGDLPDAVSGVRTLESDKGYIIIGTIDLGTDVIDVDGSSFVRGLSSVQGKLTTNNAGALLNGGIGGTIRMNDITIENIHANGSLFNFSGSGVEIALFSNIVAIPCGGNSLFSDIAVVSIQDSSITGQTSGIVLSTTSPPAGGFPIFVLRACALGINSGTLIDFGTSEFASIDVIANPIAVAASGSTLISGAPNSANFIDGFGTISDNKFSGDGTYIDGITNDDLRWTFSGNSGNSGTEDSRTDADIVMERNISVTTISAIGDDDEITAFADGGGGQVVVSTGGTPPDGSTVWIVGTDNYDGQYTTSNTVGGTSFEIAATWVSDDAKGVWETNWVKFGGITIAKNERRILMTDNYELTIESLMTEDLNITYNMSVQADGGGTKDYELGIFINDTRCFGSLSSVTTKSEPQQALLICKAILHEDDVVDVRVRNIEDTTDFIAVNASIVIRD